jgi:uncharacterized integral membrane protein
LEEILAKKFFGALTLWVALAIASILALVLLTVFTLWMSARRQFNSLRKQAAQLPL